MNGLEQIQASGFARIAGWAGEHLSPVLGVFGSSATLLCCALPTAVGAVAGTAAIGALVSAMPWLLPVARHKGWVFLAAGVLLAGNAVLAIRRSRTCESTAQGRCRGASIFARRMLVVSVAIYLIGAYFAYGRFLLLHWL